MNLTPEQIITMRTEIARMLCARNARAESHPFEDPLCITDVDLMSVPPETLNDMILQITPASGVFAFGVLQ